MQNLRPGCSLAAGNPGEDAALCWLQPHRAQAASILVPANGRACRKQTDNATSCHCRHMPACAKLLGHRRCVREGTTGGRTGNAPEVASVGCERVHSWSQLVPLVVAGLVTHSQLSVVHWLLGSMAATQREARTRLKAGLKKPEEQPARMMTIAPADRRCVSLVSMIGNQAISQTGPACGDKQTHTLNSAAGTNSTRCGPAAHLAAPCSCARSAAAFAQVHRRQQ